MRNFDTLLTFLFILVTYEKSFEYLKISRCYKYHENYKLIILVILMLIILIILTFIRVIV